MTSLSQFTQIPRWFTVRWIPCLSNERLEIKSDLLPYFMIRLELLYLYFASINVYDRYENSSSSLHRSDFLYSVDNPEHNHEDNEFVVV